MNIQRRLQIEFEFLGEEQISANAALKIINNVYKEAEAEQLTLTDVVSTSCGKCDNTGVLWSKDRLSAKTCGCK